MSYTRFKIPLLYLILVMIWGTTWSAIKVSVGETPFLMAALRFFIASCGLFVLQKIRKRSVLPAPGYTKVILALGLGNFFIGYGLSYWGMQYVNSNISALLWATMPVIVSFYAHFMIDNEKINGGKIFSLTGALLGSYLIFDIHGHRYDPQTALGMLVIICAICVASYANVIYKREGSHLDPVSMNMAGMLIGAILLTLTSLMFETWEATVLTPLTVGLTFYLAIFGSAIGFSLYFWLFKHISVVKMSYTTFLIPIFAAFWGWVLLGEGFTTGTLTGALIILLSITLPERGEFSKIFASFKSPGQTRT
jgi:drug/metabolite transporter (DMT)-like permease